MVQERYLEKSSVVLGETKIGILKGPQRILISKTVEINLQNIGYK